MTRRVIGLADKVASAMTIKQKHAALLRAAAFHSSAFTLRESVLGGADLVMDFSDTLEIRVKSLGDSIHEGTNRQRVLGAYYKAFLNLEERLKESTDPETSCCDGEVKFFRGVSEEEKAKGVAVIAKQDDRIVGRAFIAHASCNKHLSILWAADCGVREDLLVAKMMETYFEHDPSKSVEDLAGTDIRTSCVGGYSETLMRFAGADKYLLVDMAGKPHNLFPAKSLYDLAKKVLARVEEKPETAIKPAGASGVVKKHIELE